MTEVWRPVIGFEGQYEVSNMGRVRSLDRIVICEGSVKGRYESLKRGRLLRPGRMPGGHMSVALGKGNSRCVHELVLRAFLGPPPPKTEARHLDGNPAINEFENLIWDTRGHNNEDKKWHGGCSRYILLPAEILQIKAALSHPYPGIGRRLAEQFSVSPSTISCIKVGKIHVDVHA